MTNTVLSSALPLMNAPFTLVRDDHYVVTQGASKGERVVFGGFLPLTKRAATQYLKGLPSTLNHRVIKRTTARKSGLI